MSTASRSAASRREVGCPEPADVLARIESTLSCWPSSRSSSNVTSAADSTAWSRLMLHLISPPDGWVGRFPARPVGLVQEHPTLPFSSSLRAPGRAVTGVPICLQDEHLAVHIRPASEARHPAYRTLTGTS